MQKNDRQVVVLPHISLISLETLLLLQYEQVIAMFVP